MFLFLFPHASSAGELWLSVGQVKSIPAARGVPIKVGARGILRVIDGDRAIRLVAVKPGATTLVIGTRSLAVHVVTETQHAFVRDLRLLLNGFRGLRLEFDRGRPEINGTLLRFSDWRAIADLARRRRGDYDFRARVLRDVGDAAVAHFTDLARRRGFPVVRFAAEPDFTAILPRAARTMTTTVRAALSAYGVGVDLAEGEMEVRPLIKTNVVLAEVTRGTESDFGLRWPGEHGGQVLPRFESDPNLMVRLRALEARGRAQVLASPDLSCRSGGEAHFHAGGEIPIRVASRRAQNVIWKTFGVLLNVKPRADYQGALAIDIRTEISMIDFAHAVDGVPALKKSVVESQFDLPGRRTIALSGLIRRDVGASDEGLPLLSSIPLLGRLFASHQYQNHRSELVVFVTPEIVNPALDVVPGRPAGWSEDAD